MSVRADRGGADDLECIARRLHATAPDRCATGIGILVVAARQEDQVDIAWIDGNGQIVISLTVAKLVEWKHVRYVANAFPCTPDSAQSKDAEFRPVGFGHEGVQDI